MKITKKSTIEDILNHPKGKEMLAKYNVPCLGCPMAAMEMQDLKIEDVAKQYGIELEDMLKELNKEN